ARRRTSILLDLANMYGVLHIGTGDMSEIALGWSTYGGDQLAQFNPNSNLSKTMLQSLLPHLAKKLDSIEIQELVQKIVSAPISPELTPNQKTEEELGPYDLFDFILYHLIFNNESIKTTFKLCCTNFPKLSQMQIQHYMKVFIQKFYANQFKRLFGCDGIRVQKYDINALDICTSIDSSLLLNELENIKLEF
ncbi:MAG: hypothetical protein FWF58_00765, partial [Firmicutes bacterium]|nr:hypothetical protein [Bacillota bacterium]